jgi:hypothetical protein
MQASLGTGSENVLSAPDVLGRRRQPSRALQFLSSRPIPTSSFESVVSSPPLRRPQGSISLVTVLLHPLLVDGSSLGVCRRTGLLLEKLT